MCFYALVGDSMQLFGLQFSVHCSALRPAEKSRSLPSRWERSGCSNSSSGGGGRHGYVTWSSLATGTILAASASIRCWNSSKNDRPRTHRRLYLPHVWKNKTISDKAIPTVNTPLQRVSDFIQSRWNPGEITDCFGLSEEWLIMVITLYMVS